MLDVLLEWSMKWKIYVNQSKSNIVQFRKVNQTRSNHVFKLGALELGYVKEYKYLGVFFNEFVNFNDNADVIAESSGRALGSVISKLKRNNFMAYSTYSKLFETCVVPIADYASEIWGYKNYSKPNLIQNRAMRIFLGVHRYAPVAGLEGDMGWMSPQYRRWLNILRYWNRLIIMEENRLTRKMFDYAYSGFLSGCSNWCGDVFSILSSIGLQSVFENKSVVNIDNCKVLLFNKQRESWSNAVVNKPKLRFYVLFKEDFGVEHYVTLNLTSSERSVLAQIRFGILPLHVETGRFNNTKLEERKCQVCDIDAIEDECHFLFECTRYDVVRNSWVNSVITRCPDFHYLQINDQLKALFTICPRATAKFVKSCFAIRKNILYNT
jgi:hypothetical protein